MRSKVWTENSFDTEAGKVFAAAEIIAKEQECEELLGGHVFVGCVLRAPETIRKLLGREITRLPEKYELPANSLPCDLPEAGPDGMALSADLAALFLDDSRASALGFARAYKPDRRLGAAELALLLLLEPSEEISDILLENGFPNDAGLLEKLVRENYLDNLRDFSTGSPKDRLAASAAAGEKFEALMQASICGQRKAIAEVSSALTDFWHNGKNGKPLVLLLISKAGGGRSFFARQMQRAFVELGLQNKVEPPLDLSGFVHDSGCDPDLLGDAKSYRNARCGKLYNMANGNRRGMMVFEDIHGGARNAKNILRSFACNQAFDKFHEETLLLPLNVLVFTMKLDDDQYRFIREKNAKGVDAKLLNDLFSTSGDNGERNRNAAADTCALWQCADRIVLLEQLPESELAALAEKTIADTAVHLKNDYDIDFRCDDTPRFIRMLIESEPHELGPGELTAHIRKALEGMWRTICRNPGIREVKIACAELPKYTHDPARRIIRGDYLVHSRREEIDGAVFTLAFDGFRYAQQDRIDCGDYRIERPKGIVFDDIVGLDEVRDELLDSLYYITNRDHFGANVPPPCLDFILYGPPGTGKTSLAVALANSANIPVFFAASSIFTDARKLSAMFRKAREMSPAIVVLDEFNSIGDSSNPWKRDAVNELLAILDGVNRKSDLLVLASTNHLEQIEKAFLRAGRFGRQIRIGLPTAKARHTYIRKFEKEFDFSLPDEVRDSFVEDTDNISLADIQGVLGYALRRSVITRRQVDAETLKTALAKFVRENHRPGIGFTRGGER
jgi:hypothetical protein